VGRDDAPVEPSAERNVRIWSLHPRYLDPAGLVALWREGLLAQKVLLGETRGYRAHPQLTRFKGCATPVGAIGAYLEGVAAEAESRGYRFDRTRLIRPEPCDPIPVTTGQIEYEWAHLLVKLERRAPALREASGTITLPEPHPLFTTVPGEIEPWERPHG
jgi:hypothetical protein